MTLAAQIAKLDVSQAYHVQKPEGEGLGTAVFTAMRITWCREETYQGLLRLDTVPFKVKTPPEEALHKRNGSNVARGETLVI